MPGLTANDTYELIDHGCMISDPYWGQQSGP